MYQRQLRLQPWLARPSFRNRRFLLNSPLAAFFELEVLYCVGDVDIRSIPASVKARSNNLPAGPKKGASDEVFLVTRLLSDHNDPRRRTALAPDRLSCVPV
jgi:hypothetical protein